MATKPVPLEKAKITEEQDAEALFKEAKKRHPKLCDFLSISTKNAIDCHVLAMWKGHFRDKKVPYAVVQEGRKKTLWKLDEGTSSDQQYRSTDPWNHRVETKPNLGRKKRR